MLCLRFALRLYFVPWRWPPPFFIFSHNKLFLQYFSDISHCIRFYIVFDHIFIVYADLLKFVMFDLLYFLVKLSILYHSILSLLYQSLLAPFYALINSLILVHIVYFWLGFIVEKFLLHGYWSCIWSLCFLHIFT